MPATPEQAARRALLAARDVASALEIAADHVRALIAAEEANAATGDAYWAQFAGNVVEVAVHALDGRRLAALVRHAHLADRAPEATP